MNDRGFSLIGAMAGLGIAGALAVGVMKISQMGNKSAKQIHSRTEITQVHSELLSVLSDRNACRNTLLATGGNNLTSLMAGQERQLNSIKTKNNGDYIASFPTQRGGIHLEEVKLSDWDSLEQTARASVKYRYILSSNESVTRDLSFSMSFEMDPNNPNIMQSCVSRAAQMATDAKVICDAVAGADANGESYFQNGSCQFARASCEKIGRVWDEVNSLCQISEFEQLRTKMVACSNQGGYLVKLIDQPSTQTSIADHGAYNITTHIEKCSDEDMNANPSPCFCKTEFHDYKRNGFANSLYIYAAPTTGFDNSILRIDIKGAKWNVISHPYTIPNLLTGRTGKRFMRIQMKARIENHSSMPSWYQTNIGCYRVNGPHNTTQTSHPSINSQNGNSVYTGGARYNTDDFLQMPGKSFNSYETRPTIYAATTGSLSSLSGTPWANSHIPVENRDVRDTLITHTEYGYYEPGDRCVLLLYSHVADHKLGLVNSHSTIYVTQFTDDSKFLHGTVPSYNYETTIQPNGISGIQSSEEVMRSNLPVASSESSFPLGTGVKKSGVNLETTKFIIKGHKVSISP